MFKLAFASQPMPSRRCLRLNFNYLWVSRHLSAPVMDNMGVHSQTHPCEAFRLKILEFLVNITSWCLAVATASGLFATTAHARDCDSLVRQAITITPFEELASRAPKLEPKGEFETASQYEVRKAAALENKPKTPAFVAIKGGAPERGLGYDADRGVFAINDHAFNAVSFRSVLLEAYNSPFRSTGFGTLMIGVELGRDTQDLGAYEASNAFGAKVLIKQQVQTRYELVEGPMNGYSSTASAFWQRPKRTYGEAPVGELVAIPSEAQEIKPHILPAVMFSFQPPYFVEANSTGPTPARDFPYDIGITVKALVGDMHCAVLYDDRTMTVLWSRPTL